ncbi:MAG: hypothetical protein LBR23_09275 [Spirochaetaceae bacterium]|jgi:hypothetical protein|nr:hypothetical protein [Spirochaetaceae bacterium]
MKKTHTAAPVCIAALSWVLFFSCATNTGLFKKIDGQVSGASYTRALTEIEDRRAILYPERNAVLLRLDRGMIEHYAGQYGPSSADLETGEHLIEAAFTKSVTQEAGSYLVNDNAREYAGEDFEDIYINVFNALNYYQRGDVEGALVEARRSNEKLSSLSDKYANDLSALSAEAGSAPPDAPDGKVRFANSALARYLSAVLYRGSGLADDARIDFGEVKNAFAQAPSIYSYPLPSTLEGELPLDQGAARLNIIAFSGLSPVKVEENLLLPLPFPPPHNSARLALPRLEPRRSQVNRVEATAGQNTYRLELLEDLSAAAEETFKAKYALIFFKSFVRSISKVSASAVASAAAGTTENKNASLIAALIGLVGQGYALVSEQADIRCARYFPGRAYVYGVTLPPGRYTVTVNFWSGNAVVDSVEKTIDLAPGKANIIEAVSLK